MLKGCDACQKGKMTRKKYKRRTGEGETMRLLAHLLFLSLFLSLSFDFPFTLSLCFTHIHLFTLSLSIVLRFSRTQKD